MATESLQDILNVSDLVKLLKISKQTARRYILDKKVPAYRIGKGKYLISKRELIDCIENRGLGHNK